VFARDCLGHSGDCQGALRDRRGRHKACLPPPQAAGLSLGLLFCGSATDKAVEMLAYAHDTQHEKIIRGLALGLAITMYGRCDPLETNLIPLRCRLVLL
jgi:Proteasome/cyclosome repeat